MGFRDRDLGGGEETGGGGDVEDGLGGVGGGTENRWVLGKERRGGGEEPGGREFGGAVGLLAFGKGLPGNFRTGCRRGG